MELIPAKSKLASRRDGASTDPLRAASGRVLGVGAALPGRDVPGAVLTNARLSELMLEAGAWLRARGFHADFPISTPDFPAERLGVLERCVLDDDVPLLELAHAAAERALQASGVARDRVRVVIVSTVSAEQRVPSIAVQLQHALGLSESIAAFDLSLGCTGFTAAVDVATRMLAACPLGDEGGVALVVGAEAMTRMLDLCDRTTCPVFGDGAGAVVVVGNGRAPRATWSSRGAFAERISIRASGRAQPLLRISCHGGDFGVREEHVDHRCVAMDGRRVFKEMVSALPGFLEGYFDAERLDGSSVDAVLFHQANARMIDRATRACEIDFQDTCVPRQLARVGNTSSASIPIVLDELVKGGELGDGALVLLLGFGTGYSIVATRVELSLAAL